jgi:ribosomal protein S18 acetylase RimI-like enzyme
MAQFDVNSVSTAQSNQPASLVREARLEDLGQITEVLVSSFYGKSGWMQWVYPLVRLSIQEDLKQRLNTRKPYYACLAAVEVVAGTGPTMASQSVVGTVELAKRYVWPWQSISVHHLYLSNLAVRADLRRRGIALALLQMCERIALRWQIYDLYLHVAEDNSEARQLYHKAGFRFLQAEESLATWLGQPRRLLMHKPLTRPGQNS